MLKLSKPKVVGGEDPALCVLSFHSWMSRRRGQVTISGEKGKYRSAAAAAAAAASTKEDGEGEEEEEVDGKL